DKNLNVMFHKLFKSPEEFLNKNIVILHHSTNEEEFIDTFYKDYKDNLKFKFTPVGYSDDDVYLAPQDNPMYDIMWVGGENDSNKKTGDKKNSRKEIIGKYFNNDSLNSSVIGGWSDETKKEFSDINFLGALGNHGTAYKFFNSSYSTFLCSSQLSERIGLLVTRMTMALRANSVCIANKGLYKLEEYINPKYIVENKEELAKAIEEIKSLSKHERQEVCQSQLKNFTRWKDIEWEAILKR
ncbi:unnamed protein product, partial [marine sediment metagenome]